MISRTDCLRSLAEFGSRFSGRASSDFPISRNDGVGLSLSLADDRASGRRASDLIFTTYRLSCRLRIALFRPRFVRLPTACCSSSFRRQNALRAIGTASLYPVERRIALLCNALFDVVTRRIGSATSAGNLPADSCSRSLGLTHFENFSKSCCCRQHPFFSSQQHSAAATSIAALLAARAVALLEHDWQFRGHRLEKFRLRRRTLARSRARAIRLSTVDLCLCPSAGGGLSLSSSDSSRSHFEHFQVPGPSGSQLADLCLCPLGRLLSQLSIDRTSNFCKVPAAIGLPLTAKLVSSPPAVSFRPRPSFARPLSLPLSCPCRRPVSFRPKPSFARPLSSSLPLSLPLPSAGVLPTEAIVRSISCLCPCLRVFASVLPLPPVSFRPRLRLASRAPITTACAAASPLVRSFVRAVAVRSGETFGALSTLRDRDAAQARTRPGLLAARRAAIFVSVDILSTIRESRCPTARLSGRRPSRAADRHRAGREWFEHRASARLSVAPSGTSDRHSARSRIALFRLGFRLRGVQP